MKKIWWATGLMLVLLACHKDNSDGNTQLYFPKVKTIVQQNCLSCHVQGGQGMPVIFDTDQSIADRAASIKRATIDPPSPLNKRMPEGGELSDADKAVIQQWFDKGGRTTD